MQNSTFTSCSSYRCSKCLMLINFHIFAAYSEIQSTYAKQILGHMDLKTDRVMNT